MAAEQSGVEALYKNFGVLADAGDQAGKVCWLCVEYRRVMWNGGHLGSFG